MSKFFVVINGNASLDSWSSWMWSDINCCADIYLDNNTFKNPFLKKIRKLHFANKVNGKIWIPFKGIWDKSSSVQFDVLNSRERNYIIFQSGVKFSPNYIRRLKTKKNASIILYLPDTIKNLGIASNRKAFERYCRYYAIDQVFSFDKQDCKKYNLNFFDMYSLNGNRVTMPSEETCDVFYVGNCRSKSRYNNLLKIYEKFRKDIRCEFHIVGVDLDEQMYSREIIYNKMMTYSDVIKKIHCCDCILEIVNDGQDGNTLRFKEAVCYNRRLLTNNQSVKKTKYYNSKWIQVFETPEQIDVGWLTQKTKVDYQYKGEFSPMGLLQRIVEEDTVR